MRCFLKATFFLVRSIVQSLTEEVQEWNQRGSAIHFDIAREIRRTAFERVRADFRGKIRLELDVAIIRKLPFPIVRRFARDRDVLADSKLVEKRTVWI